MRGSTAATGPVGTWDAAPGAPTPLGPDLAAVGRLAVVLAAGVAGFLAIEAFGLETLRSRWVWMWPMVLTAACVATGLRLVARDSLTAFTPLPWLLAACAAYHGLGPLVHHFGTAETLARLSVPFPLGPHELWRTGLLDATGLLLVVAAFLAVSRALGPARTAAPTRVLPLREIARTGAFFLVVGLPILHGLALPHEAGRLDFLPSGSLLWLQELVPLGILVLGYLACVRRGPWIPTAAAVVVLHCVAGLLSLNKATLLFGFVALALGVFLARRRVVELGALAGAVALVYVAVWPLVIWGRGELARGATAEASETAGTGAGPGERWRTLREGWATGELVEEAYRTSYQGWWFRLSYANAQAFVMREHDLGRPGTSVAGAPWVYVPRAVWPGKPRFSDAGAELTRLMFGHGGSSTGAGVFAESYWSFGWVGVLLVGAWLGALFALLTRPALEALARLDLAFLPCAWIGMKMGFRIDGWLVTDFVGPLGFYLAWWALLRVRALALGGSNPPHASGVLQRLLGTSDPATGAGPGPLGGEGLGGEEA